MCAKAFEDFGARLAVEGRGTKRGEELPLDLGGRQMTLGFNHYRKQLLGRLSREALHGGEGHRVSGIGFEASAIFPDGVCDPALLFIENGEAEIGMIIDII